jgi:hypothetical protein
MFHLFVVPLENTCKMVHLLQFRKLDKWKFIVILPFQVACSQFLSIAKESRSSNVSEVVCFRTFVCLCPRCKHQPRWSVNSCCTITCCQIHSISFNSSQIHRYQIPVACVLCHICITIKIHRNSAVSKR